MSEPTITAEDLALYALQSLDPASSSRVDLLLRSSSEARLELSLIRGDLAALALSAPQHTPPSLSRQRLLKQVAREQRSLPVASQAEQQTPFAIDPVDDAAAVAARPAMPEVSAEERRSHVRLPRIVSEPEPLFGADRESMHDPAPAGERRFAAVPQAADMHPIARSAERQIVPERPVAAVPASQPAASHLHPIRGVAESESRPAAPELPIEGELDRYTPSGASPNLPSRTLSFPVSDEVLERPSRTPVVLAWAGWVAAAGLAAATVFALHNNVLLHRQLDLQGSDLVRTRAAAARADVVLQTIESPASQRFVLARQDTAPVPSARVAYLADRGTLVFTGTNLDPLPAYKTYELWLIPSGEGRQPMAAGTFKPDARGYATLVMPGLPKGTVAGNFGVTVEDETGSTTPTLPILLIGQQG